MSDPAIAIDGSDSGAAFGALHATIPLDDLSQDDSEKAVPGALFVDLEVQRGEAHFSQSVSAGDKIALDQVAINGPAQVAVDSRLVAGALGARAVFTPKRGGRFHVLAGLGFLDNDLRVASGGLSEREEILSIGPAVRLGYSAEPIEHVELGIDFGLSGGFADDYKVTLVDLRFATSVNLGSVGLTAGYYV